jgi:hypothetical protein
VLRPNIVKGTCGLIAAVVGLDLYSYFVQELLVSLALFSVAFLILTLAALAAVFLWWASEQLVSRSGPTSRWVIAASRRAIAAYARL